MAFHRLAIHDLSEDGNQPFVEYLTPEEEFVYMCNGEIYNYDEIVKRHGFTMKTRSDCEVIGKLFALYRDIRAVVAELDGEYAIAGIVLRRKKLDIIVIARDLFGVRPLYWATSGHGLIFSSLVAGIGVPGAEHVPPGDTWMIRKNDTQFNSYFSRDWIPRTITDNDQLFARTTSALISAVHKRLSSERSIGFLLSGGLDSSLVVAIAAQMIGKENVRTFSIGMPGGTDLEYARKAAAYLGTQHTEVLFTAEEGIAAIPDVVRACETYDITTIRASVGQYLLAKYISEKTDVKVILNGDGADEAEMGYLYFYNAPNEEEAHEESIRLLRNIHQFDGLRVDRCLAAHGLEARVPFLDPEFVKVMLSVPASLRIPTKDRMEKQFLRDAFFRLTPDLLPLDILYRKKEAFSDGVSKTTDSWFKILQRSIQCEVGSCPHIQPLTAEAGYYRKLFDEMFPGHHEVVPYYWMPSWSSSSDPSARTL